jgi:hypothetical protein
MKKSITLFAMSVVFTSTLMADLVLIGPVAESGAGLGAVNTILTFTSPNSTTTESGCVSAGPGGTTLTGSGSCPGSGPNGGPAFTGGDEQAQNSVYLASSLGITDFNNVQFIFNASEPENAADQSITLTNFSVTLWGADGLILDAKYTTGPIVFPDAFAGVGNAGFAFTLDSNQAADFNLLLAAGPAYIGAAANAIDATGGLDTISVRTVEGQSDVVPEPSTVGLFASGLALLVLARKKKIA